MIDIYRQYLEKYALSRNEIEQTLECVSNSDIHIFGATGALGLSFLKLLNIYKIRAQSVTLYVRKSSDIQDWNNYSNAFGANVKCVFIVADIEDIDLSNIDNNSTVLFFLGSAQPQKFMKDPNTLFRINVALLSRVVLKQPKYIFYSSTSEIYSGIRDCANEDSPTVSTPQHPRGAYIESKRCGEAVLASLSNEGTRSVSFRIALATPPHPISDDNRILADLVNMAKTNGEVSLRGGWNSVRQYQWGPACILKILWAGYCGSEKLYNISGGEKITLEELAKNICNFYSAMYVDKKNDNYADMGAPESVQVSSQRLEDELKYKFTHEPISELLNVYLK
jgi:nucleoside-diphosphate-sugar epimerase